jgi:hypothetical protein
MTLNTQFCQLGQHVVPIDSILSIDLNYPRETEKGGTGTNVRVWLRAQGSNLYPAMQGLSASAAPHFLDFHGLQAQSIRRWAQSQSRQGGLTVILSGAEETTGDPGTAIVAGTLPRQPARRTASRSRTARARTQQESATAGAA